MEIGAELNCRGWARRAIERLTRDVKTGLCLYVSVGVTPAHCCSLFNRVFLFLFFLFRCTADISDPWTYFHVANNRKWKKKYIFGPFSSLWKILKVHTCMRLPSTQIAVGTFLLPVDKGPSPHPRPRYPLSLLQTIDFFWSNLDLECMWPFKTCFIWLETVVPTTPPPPPPPP